jgi:hypothetical protein
MNWEEACRLLGVPETAKGEEIKEQYLYKVQLLHPDKNINKPDKVVRRAGEELAQINEAYKFLTEPKNDPNTPPALDVVPRHIRFTDVALGEKKATDIQVANNGGPFTNIWIDSSPAPWLTVSGVRAAGSEPLPLTITLEAQGLPELVDTAQCVLRMRLKNEKTGLVDEADVAIEIVPRQVPARLKVNPRRFGFKDVAPGTTRTAVLEIKNAGPDVLHGYIEPCDPWLTVSKRTINLPKRSLSRAYTVKVDPQNLLAGSRNSSRLEIVTNGGRTTIPVDMSVPKRTLRPSPAYVTSSPAGTQYARQAPTSGIAGKKLGFSFLRFFFIFVVLFAIGFGGIYLLTGDTSPGLDMRSVSIWAAAAMIVSFITGFRRK